MLEPEQNANIVLLPDGPYYQVQLRWLPRPGEKINLYSHVDESARHEANHLFEVVKIEHNLTDTTTKTDPPKKSSHFVTVYVKQA